MDDPKTALTVLARLAARVPSQSSLRRNALSERLAHLLPAAVEVVLESTGPMAEALTETLREQPCSRDHP